MKNCPRCGNEFTAVSPEQLTQYLQKANPKMAKVLELDKIAQASESLFCNECGNFSLAHDHLK
jgi:ribosomal protein S27AE